ncbi:hypothetical protein JR316_0012360 [Psilocybe cubensis]|uniref:Uncharacterized protein n=1 Tax=Psilocybe cubensis TaxID=181762 RepID=A0ACB8GJK8_PSICU|nr:hypothetical protein JR316_0012360 [Psilocybe cubensis]KAH9475249.1 hypothetical protein JR316_0012360 [Psilocybe cubensis]
MEQLQIAPLHELLSHFRYMITLRSQEGKYHSLILFRLSTAQDPGIKDLPTSESCGSQTDDISLSTGPSSNQRQIYVMESSCPHLGADMSHADIEECETGLVAVCPWHRYDFDLKTGKSETGLKACTYDVEVKVDLKDGVEKVYMQTPEEGTNWRLVELRPVSEEFADPPPPPKTIQHSEATVHVETGEIEPVVPPVNPPKTLMQWAVLILNTPNPSLKVERTRYAVDLFRTGKLSSIGHKSASAPRPPDVPSRDVSYTKNTVAPQKVKSRKNLAVMLHALANIEQWASLLTSRLAAISPSTPYGSMPVHASLWESATVTSQSLRSRLAIIHLVHEARGLDVNPATIERFRKAGDLETVKVMEIIHADEVTHVTSGHRWFTWICAQEGATEPVAAFRDEVRRGWRGDIKGPFNVDDREKAGLTPQFYEDLKGEMGFIEKAEQELFKSSVELSAIDIAPVNIEYDKE